MKKHNKICWSILLCMMLCFSVLGSVVLADDRQSNNVGFSVSPHYNSNQNKESNFFDLTVSPNSKEEIGVTVTNTSQKSAIYNIKINQASTNINGVIDYTDPKGLMSHVPFELDKQSDYQKSIQLSAGESKQIPITIAIPEVSFKGEILGGITVTKEIPPKSKQPQLMNQYSYVLGLRLREGEENEERSLSAGEVKPVVTFGKNGVTMPIVNDRANAMGHLQVVSILKREGEIIKNDTYKEREIAPNSVYPYSLNWDKKDYIPGNYQLRVTVTDAQSNKWVFNKSFTLSAKEVSKIKSASIHPVSNDFGWLWLIVGLFLLIIIALIIYIFKNRRKEEQIEGEK